jgi:DNA-binding ferritin-like protein (Dps family)
MPAIASLEDLKEVQNRLEKLKERFPEAYEEVSALLRAFRKVGYKNICKLLLGEATPEKLKGEQ